MRDHMEVSAPYYILVSRSSLTGPSSHALGHPIIQYHYADDSPLALWPQTPGQQVLVLDYNPASPSPPTVNSISKHITVTALHTLDAPGAAAAADNDHKNDTMYIIDTTAIDDAVIDPHPGDRRSAHSVLEQFKRRNTIIRRALLYPGAPTHSN